MKCTGSDGNFESGLAYAPSSARGNLFEPRLRFEASLTVEPEWKT